MSNVVQFKPRPADTSNSAADAHAAVLACHLTPDLTVGAALRWVCGEYEVYDDNTYHDLYSSLRRLGVIPHPNEEDEGIAHIRWIETLLSAYPALEKYRAVLTEHDVIFDNDYV